MGSRLHKWFTSGVQVLSMPRVLQAQNNLKWQVECTIETLVSLLDAGMSCFRNIDLLPAAF